MWVELPFSNPTNRRIPSALPAVSPCMTSCAQVCKTIVCGKKTVVLAHVKKQNRKRAIKFVLESTLRCSSYLVYFSKIFNSIKKEETERKKSYGNLSPLQLEAIKRCQGDGPCV